MVPKANETKVERLERAINSLHEAIKSIGSFIDEVHCQESTCAVLMKENRSLVSFLDEAPLEIEDNASRIKEYVNIMRAMFIIDSTVNPIKHKDNTLYDPKQLNL